MRRIFVIWAVCLCWGILNAAPLGPFNATLLEQLKNDYQKGDKDVVRYIEFQEKVAEKYIKMTPLSVTAKKKLPPSKDPRDYMTLSPYWWPDSTKTDGLPYIRKDGERNPEVYEYPERENANRFGDAAYCLGVLYYITGKEVYAKACAVHLKTWFTDPKLGMNPNMTYSQFIPGRTKLRGTGILDARHACRALCMSALIKDYAGWTEHDQTQLTEWGKAFLYWMEHSTQGQMERRAKNNHGLWFDVTHMELLAFLGYENRIREVLRDDFLQKLNNQIAENGSLPQELARTLSLHYSTFVCEASLQASFIAAGIGENLWTMKTASQKSLADVVAFLYPYYKSPEKWTYKQIKKFDAQRATPILLEAGKALGNKNYTKLAYQLGMTDKSALLMPYYDVQISH